ncbi:MAG: AAA family ATPase, partial [Duncaniella sp.]|nr:AAA family ATPase [Duncaniella sp.]
ADVVFLDEIWKAGPSIQNTLLTAINEHTFYNGGTAVKIPMKVLIAASNELPASDEGLEALWDRFLMRMISNCIDSERDFFKMLSSPPGQPAPPAKELLLTDELHDRWLTEAAKVEMSHEVRQAISFTRARLKQLEHDDGNKLRFYVSDRRWRKAYGLMQMSAFLNGRSVMDLSDFFLLVHSFWNDIEAIPAIVDTFSESISASLRNDIHEIEVSIRRSMKSDAPGGSTASRERPVETDRREPRVFDYFYYQLDGHPAGKVFFSKSDYATMTDSTRRGVFYLDKARRKLMVRALIPGKDFDEASQNATDVKYVNLRRSSDGIYIDSVRYPFVTGDSTGATRTSSASGWSDLKNMPVYRRVEEMEKMLGDIVARWEASVQATWKKEPNLFLSRADREIIDKAVKDADAVIRTVTVKLKNLRSM